MSTLECRAKQGEQEWSTASNSSQEGGAAGNLGNLMIDSDIKAAPSGAGHGADEVGSPSNGAGEHSSNSSRASMGGATTEGEFRLTSAGRRSADPNAIDYIVMGEDVVMCTACEMLMRSQAIYRHVQKVHGVKGANKYRERVFVDVEQIRANNRERQRRHRDRTKRLRQEARLPTSVSPTGSSTSTLLNVADILPIPPIPIATGGSKAADSLTPTPRLAAPLQPLPTGSVGSSGDLVLPPLLSSSSSSSSLFPHMSQQLRAPSLPLAHASHNNPLASLAVPLGPSHAGATSSSALFHLQFELQQQQHYHALQQQYQQYQQMQLQLQLQQHLQAAQPKPSSLLALALPAASSPAAACAGAAPLPLPSPSAADTLTPTAGKRPRPSDE